MLLMSQNQIQSQNWAFYFFVIETRFFDFCIAIQSKNNELKTKQSLLIQI